MENQSILDMYKTTTLITILTEDDFDIKILVKYNYHNDKYYFSICKVLTETNESIVLTDFFSIGEIYDCCKTYEIDKSVMSSINLKYYNKMINMLNDVYAIGFKSKYSSSSELLYKISKCNNSQFTFKKVMLLVIAIIKHFPNMTIDKISNLNKCIHMSNPIPINNTVMKTIFSDEDDDYDIDDFDEDVDISDVSMHDLKFINASNSYFTDKLLYGYDNTSIDKMKICDHILYGVIKTCATYETCHINIYDFDEMNVTMSNNNDLNSTTVTFKPLSIPKDDSRSVNMSMRKLYENLFKKLGHAKYYDMVINDHCISMVFDNVHVARKFLDRLCETDRITHVAIFKYTDIDVQIKEI